ncbi:MAG: hypothetical protein DIU63_11930 [Proteobacteria bacterium]|nr:MAG: hypothetical protein DIU63_11930 [Pseudomonadota bacterium]
MRAAPSATIDEVAVVIIGGGIIGCSIAYHLAKRGITDVLVLDRNQLASGATARAAGLVCHARSDTSTIHMVKRTLAAIDEMEALLEEKIDFHPVGSVRAIFSEARLGELEKMEACLTAAGVEFSTITPAEAKRLCPWLELGDARRIVFVPADGYIDGAHLGSAYARAARKLGVRIRSGIEVTGLLTDGPRVTGVETNEGLIRANWVVDAAGVWGAVIASWLGWGLAAAPTRSHYWITAPDGSGTGHQPNVHLPDMRAYLRSEVGGLVIGLQEPKSLTYDPLALTADMADMPLIDEERDTELLVTQASELRKVIPKIDEWGFAHHIAGLSNYTPDGKFVIGRVPEIEGFLLAGGCCGSGVAASGGFGLTIAELIAGIEPSIDVMLYRPDRFGRVDPSSEAFRERCAAARSGKSRGRVDDVSRAA